MRAVVYAETFGNPSEAWMWRQVRALGVPLVTHEHRRAGTFPYDQVHVVERRRAPFDSLVAGARWLRARHGYRLPPATERALAAEFETLGAELVHAHYGPAGLRAAPAVRGRLLVTFHGFDVTRLPRSDAGYRRALRGLFARAYRCIAVSGAVRDRLLALGCPRERIALLPLGVPVHAPRQPRAGGGLRAITVARLHAVKGIPDLVDAVAAVRARGVPLELDVIGEGEERAEIERRRGEGVHLHGALAPETVLGLLDEADLFVLNARTTQEGDTESLGIALLEAMERGLPVVATRHGGIPEIVADGANGLLVPERDTAALAGALENLARDPGLRERMGAAGRKRVETDYDLARCTEALRALYV